MSNLKLPTMTFVELESLCEYSHKTKTLAYATTAEYVAKDGSTDAYVIIRHHGTVIAEIARGWVYVTNSGYDSQTTRERIHKILTDNRQNYGTLVLGQNKGDQVLSFRGTSSPDAYLDMEDRVLTRLFYNAHWDFENREVDMWIHGGAPQASKVTL